MLAFGGRITSFVLQSTVFSHGDDTALTIPLIFRAVGITGDVNQVAHSSGVEDWGASMKIGRVKAREAGVPASLAGTRGCGSGWGESSARQAHESRQVGNVPSPISTIVCHVPRCLF